MTEHRDDDGPNVGIEHLVRVTSPSTGVVNDGPIMKTYTWDEAMQAAYNWGRVDGHRTAEDLLLYGEDEAWTTAGVPLAQLRSKFGNARRDG
jgi:hypothetical protein